MPRLALVRRLADARRVVAARRIDYNRIRPHSSLGYRTPEVARFALAATAGTAKPVRRGEPAPSLPAAAP